jgi:hypothetical protein
MGGLFNGIFSSTLAQNFFFRDSELLFGRVIGSCGIVWVDFRFIIER